MNTPAELRLAVAEIERARQLVQQLPGKAASAEISAIAAQIDDALSAAASYATSATNEVTQLTQRLDELSSVVVGSTIRHF